MTYVIGDVHGYFEPLKELVLLLPKPDNIYFVGDLIDRGPQSKQVISFIKENGYKSVLGNHEKMLLDISEYFIANFPKIDLNKIRFWYINGGKETLQSYNLIDSSTKVHSILNNPDGFEKFKQDIKWIQKLPLFIDTQLSTHDNKPVIVSHAAIANVWKFKSDRQKQDVFEEYALWNRNMPKKDCEIFNIYGHSPQTSIELDNHYINIDSGCYKDEQSFGKLSAYCIENNTILQHFRSQG